MTTVYEHLEAFAGEIIGGWSSDADGTKLPFQIVQTAGGLGTTTFATLGLSKFPLPGSRVGREPKLIRHELLMIVPTDAVPPQYCWSSPAGRLGCYLARNGILAW